MDTYLAINNQIYHFVYVYRILSFFPNWIEQARSERAPLGRKLPAQAHPPQHAGLCVKGAKDT